MGDSRVSKIVKLSCKSSSFKKKTEVNLWLIPFHKKLCLFSRKIPRIFPKLHVIKIWWVSHKNHQHTSPNVSKYGVISGPNTGKYEPEVTLYFGTFHAVCITYAYHSAHNSWVFRFPAEHNLCICPMIGFINQHIWSKFHLVIIKQFCLISFHF